MKQKHPKTAKSKITPLLGAHFSIAGGLEKALFSAAEYGCRALQIFTKNASTWKERDLTGEEIRRFDRARDETGMVHIASHTSYLINLAAPDPDKHQKSCRALVRELIRCRALSIPYVVLHPGAHMGAGENAGLEKIADSINRVLSEAAAPSVRLLLETTAGQGSGLGHRFEQLAAVIDRIDDDDRVGVCIDTCHIFAAGYDIRTPSGFSATLAAFHRTVGLERLCLLHLNDAKKDLGSRVDRHEHLGRGKIGEAAFARFMTDPRLQDIPKIIETPKKEDGKDWDRINLDFLRSFC